ncbi:GTPase [Rothia sp. (in: high G+C Gram-positive bacteria)]|uniref:GTPase n=1 Tax=Rothia sp. (in: high G+C Gram-positive bacteria) TaxID=1885016 RepID=UPI001CB05347|nr:GTPase [Rothia sp. (in: high G+C Gram-positive bacteria)]MBF1655459.1 50S ribosome-binding GTPase [Rothia sp. (in: high G+C Gram-positive bacteria)]
MTTPENKLENTERDTKRGTAPGVATSPFARSVASLKEAIGYGEGRVPETVLLDAAETLERLSQRRELSTEHTVIGFFGATGSGKSTLFNAIAGQNIALSAPTRPTTSTVQAAIWEAEGSEELLDWLGIDKRVYPQTQALTAEGNTAEGSEAAGGAAAPNAVTEPAPGLFNRIRRAVGGRGEMRTRTGGLILLDMPDFDSVTTTNRDLAARMMRYVDVLVWVVDPQKYADAVIHRDFMVPLAASGAQALCVLNQADKLAPAEVPAVLASLTRLLQAEGTDAHLLAAPIAVSARTGEGVDVLRDLLAQVAAAKSLSLQRTDAQLHATASQLRTYAGGEGTVLAGAYALDAEQKLVQACYTSSHAEQVLQAATASYRRAAGQHTGWILTRWMSRLKADPLRRLHLGQQDETKSTSKAEKSAGMLGSDSENAPELVASSLPPLSAAQKAGMANAVRQYSKQMANRIDEPWKRSMKEAALSREAELPELLERDMMRIDYGLGRTRAPWVVFNALQWIALLSALAGVAWLTLISGMAYLQIQLPPAPTPEGSPVPLPTLLLLLGVLLGIASAGVGRLLTAMGSRYYARKLRGRLQTGVEKAVQSCVVAPVQQEAKRLNAYRKALDI